MLTTDHFLKTSKRSFKWLPRLQWKLEGVAGARVREAGSGIPIVAGSRRNREQLRKIE